MGDSRRHIFTYIQVGASNRNKAGGCLPRKKKKMAWLLRIHFYISSQKTDFYNPLLVIRYIGPNLQVEMLED